MSAYYVFTQVAQDTPAPGPPVLLLAEATPLAVDVHVA